MQSFSKYFYESSLSRIWKKTQDYECGAISGYRNDNSKEKNKQNNRDILNYLQGKGYSLTKVAGSYIENFGSETQKEVSEPSFFVCDHKDTGNLVKDMSKIAQRFDQDSILIVPKGGKNAYLLGTSKRDNSYPSYGKKEIVGSGKFGKTSGEFLSRIKGREFTFEEIDPPGTINGKRGQMIFVETVDNET